MNPPQNIGKYELIKCLGGGMSQVYMARDTLIGRTVAIKILTETGAYDDVVKARFIREAQLAGNVIHDNIIRVYDFGEESGRLFMVMEFLEGEDLNDAIRGGRTGSIQDRIGIAAQIARAMEHVHSLQIVHRDLKPHNVYMTKAGMAKLMDFGIAKTDQTSMTKTGFTVGTPSYMAPEQVLGKQVNHLSDVYAFGILLFELVTGTKPLGGDSVERVFWQILHEPVDLAPLRTAGAPEPLVELIGKCTQKEPPLRPQSFTLLRQQLEGMRRGGDGTRTLAHYATAAGSPGPPPVAPAPPPPRVDRPEAPDAAAPVKRKRWLVPVAALTALLLAVIGVLLFRWGKPASGSTGNNSPATVVVHPVLPLPSGDMVLVDAGTFLFGEQKIPRQTPAYYIDRTEVTNEAYGAFLKATGYAAPPGFSAAQPAFPVVDVTIKDAREFAKWAGKRLPDAMEWEKAARGTDGRKYTWGNKEQTRLAAVKGGAGLREAGNESGKSPYGAMQMTGNVWELVDDPQIPSTRAIKAFAKRISPAPTATEPWCMIRGGSYLFPLQPVYELGSIPERFHEKDIGFRCVRDVK